MSKKVSNAPHSEEYNHDMFIALEACKRYTMIERNITFIKEKDFEHLEDFSRKDIANKGWRELCKPLGQL